MQLQELKCFGAHPGDGNPALVIEDDHSTTPQRQAFARERNMTCVFLDPADTPDAACVLDYFYPHTRSPLCLHATLAAARVLFARQDGSASLAVTTKLRGQRLVLARDGDKLFVRLGPQEVPQIDIAPDLPARLLAAPGLVPAAPPRLASVGSPKLLIEVADTALLDGLRPDLQSIVEWGKANAVNGCYVYCRTGDGAYEGRNFNHLDPALEDSATGVAAGALTVLLGRGITLRQGKATGHACLIRTRVDGDAILVGGRAEPATSG
ncbi:PhzF family phenazine biosynthesis protein [Massilia horti]|uniref:PhzF family phenazine biosynthesis protein n=1 Tax=Massilia horti TaxID=2562153 RepID=A0A4Y9T5C5_9BURK|nr:PhzF family phenazine biosynthesis protein [Massilia horti]TFW36168.1 PhzF family phenazine biosynthesis protein [Massilia horti]